MKILIVGGTGFIGGDAATLLQSKGHAVTVGARKAAPPESAMAKMPLLTGDYIEDGYTVDELRGFDAVVFAAGSDVRHVDLNATAEEHWIRANAKATPRFFERVREAGVKRAILIGSFYPQAAPNLIETVPYIAARYQADIAVRAMASENFHVCSINPPYVVGTVPGVFIPALAAYIGFALGTLPIPRTAPAGGANFISVASLSQASEAALRRGETGKAYLVGDENLSFKEYLELYFRAVGDHAPIPVSDDAHALFPDSMLFAGRKGTIYYEPDAAETALLGYRRHDIRRAVEEIAAAYRPIVEAQSKKRDG